MRDRETWFEAHRCIALCTLILPVTAAEISVVQYSLRSSMASRTLLMSASIFAVSWSRKAAICFCSSTEGVGSAIPTYSETSVLRYVVVTTILRMRSCVSSEHSR